MLSKMIALGVTLQLFDRMSGGLKETMTVVDGLRAKIENVSLGVRNIGAGALASGMMLAETLKKPVMAFSELEDAQTRLKSVMMRADGTAGAFDEVSALANRLGGQLPGATADFTDMMSALREQGIAEQSILGGVGESAAQMAVLLKQPPRAMAEFTAQMKKATGVADADMFELMDTIQRTVFMGVDVTKMGYAFARSAGALKTVGLQGLKASQQLAPLFAMLINSGLSGETVGTGFGSMISQVMDFKKMGAANKMLKEMGTDISLKFTQNGKFAGVENMMKELGKLKGLSDVKLNAVLKTIFGGGQDQSMAAIIVKEGEEGYAKQKELMDKQAALAKRVDAVLGTLTNMWEAAEGAFTGFLVSIGEAMGDDLKALVTWFGDISERLEKLVTRSPVLTKWFGRIALALAAILIVGGGLLTVLGLMGSVVSSVMSLGAALTAVGGAAGLMSKAIGLLFFPLKILMSLLGFLMANPYVLLLVLITAAVLGLIHALKNMEEVKKWLSDLWDSINILEPFRKAMSEEWALITARFNAEAEMWKARFDAFVNYLAEKFQFIKDLMPDFSKMIPDWIKRKTESVESQALEMFGPAQPSAAPGGETVRVGGDIRIHLDQEGRVNAIHAVTANPLAPMEVDTGYYMGLSN